MHRWVLLLLWIGSMVYNWMTEALMYEVVSGAASDGATGELGL